MNIKKSLFVFAALAALTASAYDDVQVVYRGKVKRLIGTLVEGEVEMTFKLYPSKGSNDAFWSTTTNVLVDATGRFQVALRGTDSNGNNLAEQLDGCDAAWIGVSIDGESEQSPRQELTAAARAERAQVADSLAASPQIGQVDTGTLEAEGIRAMDVAVDGAVNVKVDGTVKESVVAEVPKVEAKGEVKFFSRSDPAELGTRTASGGGCSFGTAAKNCVVLFSTTNKDWMPGASVFFKKGETIEVPASAGLADGTTVKAWRYDIGAE